MSCRLQDECDACECGSRQRTTILAYVVRSRNPRGKPRYLAATGFKRFGRKASQRLALRCGERSVMKKWAKYLNALDERDMHLFEVKYGPNALRRSPKEQPWRVVALVRSRL